MDTVYIETSIVSYLRQKPSSQVVMAARQLLTHQWWNDERTKYQLVASQFVIDEASAGDPQSRCRASAILDDIPLLPLDSGIVRHCRRDHGSRNSSGESPNRCTSHRGCGTSSDTIFVDVELSAHCQRTDSCLVFTDLLNDLSIPIPVICTPEEMVANDTETDDD